MELANLTWPAVAALSPNTPVVVPIGSLEQHGHHLPLFTDSLLVGEVARRAAAQLGERVVWTPVMWLGNSEHHLDFAGTLTAAPRTYLDMLRDLIENLIGHGFRRIVLFNGHGGNNVPAQQALFEARQQHRDRSDLLLVLACYWSLGRGTAIADADFVQSDMGHACEWEASMVLRLAPQLVGNYKDALAVEFGHGFEPASRAWITQDRSRPGHIGTPAAATAEKGEKLLARFTNDAVQFLERVLAWDGTSWDG